MLEHRVAASFGAVVGVWVLAHAAAAVADRMRHKLGTPQPGESAIEGDERWVLSEPMATSDATQAGDGAQQGGNGRGRERPRRRNGPQGDRLRRGQARPAGQGDLPHRPREDAAHPPLRGARRRDVRQGEDRRLPPPLYRRGGDHRRRHPGAPRHRLPDVDLPRARPGASARHTPERRHGRAVRPRRRLLQRPRRLHAPVRLGQALPRRLRHRRRLAPAVGGRRARRRLSGHGGRDPLDDGRRGHEPGHVRRDDEPRRALEASRWSS